MLAVIPPLLYSKLLADTAIPRFSFITLLSLISVIILLLVSYKKSTLFVNKFFLLPLAIFIWSAISLSWSLDVGNTLIKIPHFLSSLIILFLAMQIKFYKQQNFIINGAIISCFLVTLIGVFQAFNVNPFNIHYNTLPASTFVNKSHASIYIEFFVPILLLFLLYKDDIRSKVLYSVTLSLALFFLYVLSSFGTLVSVTLALTFSGFILSRHSNLFYRLKKNYIYLFAILLGSILLTSAYTPSIKEEGSSFSTITKSINHTRRLALYTKSLSAIVDYPITGFGYGAYRAGIIPYIAEVQSITNHNENIYYTETHNDFLQKTNETGIVSGLLFLSFFLIILYLGFSSIKSNTLSKHKIFIFSISSGLLVLVFHSFIDFPFHLPASNYLIYLSSGFILSATAKKIFFKKNINLKISMFLILILLYAMLFTTTYYNTKHIESNKLIRDAAIALEKEQNCIKSTRLIDMSNQLFEFAFQSQKAQTYVYSVCSQEIEKYRNTVEKLIALNPTNFRAHFLLGNLYLIENKLTLAFKEYYYVVTMLPNSAIGYIGMGKWAIKNNKFKDAKIYLEKAKSLDPTNNGINSMLEALNKNTQ